MKWNPTDPLWDESDYDIQVWTSYGVQVKDTQFMEKNGLFFIDDETLLYGGCFASMEYATDRSDEGYSNDWYDLNNDPIWGDN